MTRTAKMATIVAAIATASALALSGGSARAVVGGSPDGSAHPYVGAAEQPRGTGYELCSGALVSPRVFVTAAHCFGEGSAVQVSFDQDVSSGASPTWHSGKVHLEDGFCLDVCGNGLPGGDTHDLAVVVFDTGVSAGPFAELPAVGSAEALVNQQVDVVGYGVQTFSPLIFGTRQVATTKVLGGGAIGDEFLKLLAAPGACLGDSGGPDLVSGTDTMVAITSFSNANPGCNGVSYSERLDTPDARAFIDSWVANPS